MKKKELTNLENTEKFSLQLYVSGMSEKSMAAIKNVKHLCDNYIKDKFELEIIDIYKTPEAAQKNQVVFSPSLVKSYPLPRKVLIGTFADTEKVIKYLNIIP